MLVTREDVLVRGPQEALDAVERARLDAGAGLVVLGAGPWAPDLVDLLTRSGVTVTPRPPVTGPLVTDPSTARAVTDEDLLARVVDPEGTAGAHLDVGTADDGAAALLRDRRGDVVAVVGAGSRPAGAGTAGHGRIAVVAVDLADGPSARALRDNLVAWVAPPVPAPVTGAARRDELPPAWHRLRDAVDAVQAVQARDGSVPDVADHPRAGALVREVVAAVRALVAAFPQDTAHLEAVVADLTRWAADGFGVPDFLDSLVAFQPQTRRENGLRHLVVLPMTTQNGSPARHLEAVVVEVVWPDLVAELEAGPYSNALFVPIRFVDFTAGYATNSAVLFPETVAVRELPVFTWGAIFADREAARFRRVVRAAARTTGLALPPDAARLLEQQQLAEEVFVLWDLIHDRTHMRGDLPFDPFMIKQRMPYFLYSLEELRCDLTAFREAVRLEEQGLVHARLAQYAIVLDRIFRFPVTGTRVRNYDGLGGQLLFAWLHQRHVLHWTDNRLTVDWQDVPAAVLELGRSIEDLYWRSIDRPKVAHWLAAYELVRQTLTPHPASTWARGPEALPLDGPLKGLTDAVLPDEFPLSMFYEALDRRIGDVVASTSGITGASEDPAGG